MRHNASSGFTLLELLITIAVIAIIVSIGSPSILTAQRHLNLKGAVENSFFHFQLAKSSAIRLSSPVIVDVTGGANWCVGVTDQAGCDCNVANSCSVDGVEKVVAGADFTGVQAQNINFNPIGQLQFDGVRGFNTGNAASMELTDGTNTVRLNVNTVGRASICIVAGELGNYTAC